MRLRGLRVALISTPFVPVPPPEYGGTELIVAEIASSLAARGIEPVVYTTGDSTLAGVECRSYFPKAVWPPDEATDRTHSAWALRDIARDPRGFDLIHSHTLGAVELCGLSRAPMLHTMHHDLNPSFSAIYAAAPGVRRVAISHNQARREPTGCDEVVHHGLNPERFHTRADGGYLLFLGRYSRVKGPHLAIDVARKAGLPIVLAGRPHHEDEEYFETQLRHRLQEPHVRDVGQVGGARKAQLLAGARALVFPIDWDEPFGLVMIEAMLCGVPVLALRRGSVPEVVDEGLTGFICDDETELVLAAKSAHRLDREAVRVHAQRRFSASVMTEAYVDVYDRTLALAAGAKPARDDEAGIARDDEPREAKLGA